LSSIAAVPHRAASVIAYSAGNASEASTGAFAGSIGETVAAPGLCHAMAWFSLACGSPRHPVTRKKLRRTVPCG
jgi:hypothetical protein